MSSTVTQKITALPAAPSVGSSNFDIDAERFTKVLPNFGTELNTFAEQVNVVVNEFGPVITKLTAVPPATIVAAAQTATTKASEAAASASSADGSATLAWTNSSLATQAATTATTKAGEASTSATNALASKNAAATSETNALASKNAAATSATTATTKAGEASTSATNAAASATAAAGSATTATTKASEASTSATNAAGSATTATTKATEAATSASTASTAATNATTKATNAATSEANALTYKNAASTSATNAATSATNAAASASTATIKASEAAEAVNVAGDNVALAESWAADAASRAATATTKASEAAASASVAAAAINPLWLGAGIPPTTILPTFQWRPGREDMPSIVTATRASIATRTNELGLIEQVAANVMREDFDPVTGECLGLLIEEQRANLLTYSEDFSNAAWSKRFTATVTANAVTSPSGDSTADTLSLPANSDRIDYIVAVTGGTTYTGSVWLKGSGTIGLSLNSSGGTYKESATSITLTQSWARYSVTLTTNADNTSVYLFCGRTPTGSNHTATSVSIWGAQLEAGAFPTSYIPTTSAAVTRSADVVTVATSAFPYNASEGTLYANVYKRHIPPASKWPALVELNSGSISNRLNINNDSAGAIYAQANINWITTNISSGAALTYPMTAKVAFGFKSSDMACYLNGVANGANSTVGVPSGITKLHIGSSADLGELLNGHIRHVAYFPRRVSNSQLQLLTA